MAQTQFVGDYTAKTAEAKRLRALQEAMGKQTWDDGTVKTAANANFPGQEQINWGSALGKLGLAYMGRGAEEKAATAETEAQAAQMAAVSDAVAGGGDLTPEKIMQLQQLGIDAPTLKLMQGDKNKLGAITQAYGDRNQLRALLDTGTITQEKYDAALASIEANETAAEKLRREGEAYDQSVKRFAPDGSGPTSEEVKINLWRTDPALAAQVYGDKTAAGEGGGGSKRYDPERQANLALFNADKVEKLINENADEMFGTKQRSVAAINKYNAANPGSILSLGADIAGIPALESGPNTEMRIAGVNNAIQALALMAPASDTDFMAQLSTQANAIQSEEGARAVLKTIREAAEIYRKGGSMNPGVATTPPPEEEWGIVE